MQGTDEVPTEAYRQYAAGRNEEGNAADDILMGLRILLKCLRVA